MGRILVDPFRVANSLVLRRGGCPSSRLLRDSDWDLLSGAMQSHACLTVYVCTDDSTPNFVEFPTGSKEYEIQYHEFYTHTMEFEQGGDLIAEIYFSFRKHPFYIAQVYHIDDIHYLIETRDVATGAIDLQPLVITTVEKKNKVHDKN